MYNGRSFLSSRLSIPPSLALMSQLVSCLQLELLLELFQLVSPRPLVAVVDVSQELVVEVSQESPELPVLFLDLWLIGLVSQRPAP